MPGTRAKDRYRKPGQGSSFSCPQRVEPSSGKHRDGEGNHAHELFGKSECGPERYHMIEDFVESTVSPQCEHERKGTEQSQRAQVAAAAGPRQRKSRYRDAEIQTHCPQAAPLRPAAEK